jgi:hypothetical protein
MHSVRSQALAVVYFLVVVVVTIGLVLSSRITVSAGGHLHFV